MSGREVQMRNNQHIDKHLKMIQWIRLSWKRVGRKEKLLQEAINTEKQISKRVSPVELGEQRS